MRGGGLRRLSATAALGLLAGAAMLPAQEPPPRPGSAALSPARPPAPRPVGAAPPVAAAGNRAADQSPFPRPPVPAPGTAPPSQDAAAPEAGPSHASDTGAGPRGVPGADGLASGPDSLRESDFDFAACRLALTLGGAEYEPIPPLTDPADPGCGIARPLRVTRILPGVALSGAADLRCDTARALAGWLREAAAPAAAHLPGAPRITGVSLGTAYACRGVVGGASAARLSEHATGNAIDIAGFVLDDGTTLPVQPRPDRGDMTAAFQNAVQGSACLFFSTVLGPGSNAAHADHLHLDIKARRGGFRLCQ